jgi:serine/alanine adding enzyme
LLELVRNKEVDRREWEFLLTNGDFSSPFQSAEFLDIYNSLPDFTAEVYAVREKEKLISLCVITIQHERGVKKYFSKRGIIYGGPLIQNKRTDALDLLLKGITNDLKNKVIYLETRNLNDYTEFKGCFEGAGWKYVRYLDFVIDLKDKTLDETLSLMKYNRKREINNSLNSGAVYDEAKSPEQVAELYSILKELYSEKVKLPLPELDYFLRLFNSPVGKVFVVSHRNKIIGGSFCYYLNNKSIYTLYYCGIRDYDKKIFPTHLAIIAPLEFGIKNDLQTLGLMGAGKPEKDYGVREFKAQFGGKQVENGRFIRINNTFLYNLGKLGLSIISKSGKKN